jgi:hypothetical protein
MRVYSAQQAAPVDVPASIISRVCGIGPAATPQLWLWVATLRKERCEYVPSATH